LALLADRCSDVVTAGVDLEVDVVWATVVVVAEFARRSGVLLLPSVGEAIDAGVDELNIVVVDRFGAIGRVGVVVATAGFEAVLDFAGVGVRCDWLRSRNAIGCGEAGLPAAGFDVVLSCACAGVHGDCLRLGGAAVVFERRCDWRRGVAVVVLLVTDGSTG